MTNFILTKQPSDISTVVKYYQMLGGITFITLVFNFIWFMINIKSNKKIKKAKGVGAVATAQSKKIDNSIKQSTDCQKNIDWVMKKLEEMDYKEQKHQQKSNKQQLYIQALIKKIYDENPYYCANIQCKDRDPAWGMHKTIFAKLSEYLKEEND